MYTVCFFFLLFVLYSFLGWCMEVVVVFFDTKQLVNRGFLVGPICPIYGSGCLLIIFLLQRYMDDPVALFVMSLVLCSILEYFTSYMMEKLFKARWWDYSDKKFNVNGRICLSNCLAFGALGLAMMYFINPILSGMFSLLSSNIIYILSILFLLLYIVDTVVSFKVISGFKNVAKSIHKDSTAEITKKVREMLMKKGVLYKRLVSAFDFEASERLLKDLRTKVKNTLRKVEVKAKETLEQEKKKQKEKNKNRK